MYASGRDIASV
jgi:hypothetical protein